MSEAMFIMVCAGLVGFFYFFDGLWPHKDQKVESKDPDGWPCYTSYDGRVYCKPEEVFASRKFKRECEKADQFFKKHKPVSAELIVVIAHFLAARHEVKLTLEDTSGIIVRLEELQLKMKFQEIAMRRVPHGYYSEDLEAFFGRMCGAGYAHVENHSLCLERDGLRVFQEIVGEFFSEEPLVFIELARSIWQVMYPRFFKAPIV